MFRKTLIAAVTVAFVATSAVAGTTNTAHAKNGRNAALAAGAFLGLAAGAIIVGNHRKHRRHNYRHNGYNRRHRAVCYDKPIRRWNRYDELVIVGYRTVCR